MNEWDDEASAFAMEAWEEEIRLYKATDHIAEYMDKQKPVTHE